MKLKIIIPLTLGAVLLIGCGSSESSNQVELSTPEIDSKYDISGPPTPLAKGEIRNIPQNMYLTSR